MILSPSQSIWTPRFGAWWRRAKEWRASIETWMGDDLKYGTGGHLTYKSSGGHLVYCPVPPCSACSGTTPSGITGTVASHTICPGSYTLVGNGGSGNYDYVITSGDFNGTYSLTQNLYGTDTNCFYAYHEYPTSRISATWVAHGGGSPNSDFSFNINLAASIGSSPNWRYIIYVFGGNVNGSGTSGDPLLILTSSDTNSGAGTFNCMANFTVNNLAASCVASLLYGGSFSGSPF